MTWHWNEGKSIRQPALLLVVAASLVALAAVAFPSLILSAIDPTGGLRSHPPLLADFRTHFLAQGAELLRTGLPVQGFYYSALAGCLFVPFSLLPEGVAAALWLALMVGLVATLAALTWRWAPPAALPRAALALALSVPVYHDLRWGQVSLLLLALCVAGFQAYARGWRWWAASALGLAIAIKLYPAALLLYFVVRRDTAFALRAALVAAVLLLAPAALLGLGGLSTFQNVVAQRSNDALHEWVWKNANSQNLAHVLLRWAPGLGNAGAATVAYGAAAAALVGFWATSRGDTDPARRFCWLAGITALLTPTAWAHYFAFLPLSLAVTAAATSTVARRGIWWAALVASSVPTVLALGWDSYVRSGALCLANLLVLALLWLSAPRGTVVE